VRLGQPEAGSCACAATGRRNAAASNTVLMKSSV
jgi:hypothetical protein